jgi:excisionase family DNA binding protein
VNNRKIYCCVVEGAVYEDRCLWKLRKMIEDSKDCENCILRELESKSIKVSKTTKASKTIKASNILKVSKMASDTEKLEGIKRGPKKRSRPIENGKVEERYYSIKELSKGLGKAERTLQEWAAKKKIPAVRIGIKWCFPKEEIDRLFPREKEESPEFQKADILPGNRGNPEKAI